MKYPPLTDLIETGGIDPLENVETGYHQPEIFVPCQQLDYQQVKDSIPKEAQTKPSQNWYRLGQMEWRWRFLKLPTETPKKYRRIAEISRMSPVSSRREYAKSNGEWVFREVSSVFDEYVDEEYYYYTDLS